MKTTTILSAADKETLIPECEPGETVTITGTLGEPDAAGNYPVTVESVTAESYEEEEVNETPPMPRRKAMMAEMESEMEEAPPPPPMPSASA